MEHVAQRPTEMENEAQIAGASMEKYDGLGTTVDFLENPVINHIQCSDDC